ncbi:MAG: threonylcarbamoyl-AMP synthase [Ignavibacteria bacterium GWF2_33_9]|nr:MAG: threonylcarbamoyl-AMP synthase [Ignavibacteria bacterium GWF2_33_9]
MPSEILTIHPKNPEIRKITKVADVLRNGSVILYPTDTGYTLGCKLSNKNGIEKIRRLRKVESGKSLTFLCDSLTNLSDFAKVSDSAYKTMRSLVPGPYTFILPASKQVPVFAQDAKRKTAGIRVPRQQISLMLLQELGEPIISISARIPDYDDAESWEIFEYFSKQLDIVVQLDEDEFDGPSTVIDMTGDEFVITREGAGMELLSDFIIAE